MARLHIHPFDDNLHRAVKTSAYSSGLSLKAWVEQACREKLRRDADPERAERELAAILNEEERL